MTKNNLLHFCVETQIYNPMYSIDKKMIKTIVIMAAIGLSIASQLFISPIGVDASGGGLKVNLVASSPRDGMGSYCVSGGGDTVCENAEVPGKVQIKLDVEEGDSIRGCVDFNGRTECDSGTNTDCKCPEDLFVTFGSSDGGRDSSSSSSAASSSSSSTSGNSNSASASSSLCLAFCNSPNSDPVFDRNNNEIQKVD